MAERKERVEVAISRNCFYFLRERYGKRKSLKAVIELAAKEAAGKAAEDYLDKKGYKSVSGQVQETEHSEDF